MLLSSKKEYVLYIPMSNEFLIHFMDVADCLTVGDDALLEIFIGRDVLPVKLPVVYLGEL